MKKTLAITLMTIAMAGSLLASGAQEGTTYSKIEKEQIKNVTSALVQVIPSDDVLDIFSDNDDDGLFDAAEPFMKGEADRHEISNDVSAYISETIFQDPDDLMETINDELKAALESGKSEGSFMILGNNKISATMVKTEGAPTYITYTREVLDFTPIETVSVSASDDVLAVFSDNDDDGLYDETLPFLNGTGSRNDMTKDAADFVYSIISQDTDDIMDLIRDELKAPLESGKVEKSEMVLGNYKFTSTIEAPQVFKFSSEEIFYEPGESLVIAASDDILSVFEDNDDDGLYEEALPYLTGMADMDEIPVAVADYISDVLYDDCDDVMDDIRDELNAALEESKAESASMELGNYIFTASTDYAG